MGSDGPGESCFSALPPSFPPLTGEERDFLLTAYYALTGTTDSDRVAREG